MEPRTQRSPPSFAALVLCKKNVWGWTQIRKKKYPPFYSTITTINIKKLSCTCTENCYTCTSTRFTSVGGADVMCNPFTSFHSRSSGCTPVPYGPYRLFFTSSLGLRRLCTAGDHRLDVQLIHLLHTVWVAPSVHIRQFSNATPSEWNGVEEFTNVLGCIRCKGMSKAQGVRRCITKVWSLQCTCSEPSGRGVSQRCGEAMNWCRVRE